jgi:hypothetical protein
MTQLYGRKVSLVVGTNSGNALDLSQMHMRFSIRKATVGTPSILECRVWNLSANTVKTLTASGSDGTPEFNKVVLQAGYVTGQFGTIFQGNVIYYRSGRESPTDTYVIIYAADGDRAHNYALVNATVPAGSKPADVANALNGPLAAKGLDSNNAAPPNNGIQYPRGKVCFGKAADYARDLAANTACQWSVQNGAQQYVPRTTPVAGEALVVNSATGMLGIPIQTIYGIEVRILMNPNIKYGGVLKINNKDIQTAELQLIQGGIGPANSVNQLGPQFLSADGYYKVIAGEYTGDTRGTEWDTLLWCVSLDTSGTSAGAAQAGWIPGP